MVRLDFSLLDANNRYYETRGRLLSTGAVRLLAGSYHRSMRATLETITAWNLAHACEA